MSEFRDQMLGQTLAAHAETNRVSHEATVTGRILKILRPDVSLSMLRQELGELQLTLETIQTAVPGFPLRLIAEHVPYLHQMTYADTHRPITQLKIFQAYRDQLERRGWDDREMYCGLVTTWPEVGSLVFHNWPRTEERLDRHKGYHRDVWVHSKGAEPMVYSMEPLDSLLLAIHAEGICEP